MTGFITIEPKSPIDLGRWGVTFLIANSRMSEEESEYLMIQATEMYSYKEDRRNLEADSFEGRLWTDRKYATLGCFSGMQYDACLEMDKNRGKVKVRFLVSEQTGSEKGLNYN